MYMFNNSIVKRKRNPTSDTALGIGTFGGNNSGSNLELQFFPDSDFASSNIVVSSFSQCFYSDFDVPNTPPDLEYEILKNL